MLTILLVPSYYTYFFLQLQAEQMYFVITTSDIFYVYLHCQPLQYVYAYHALVKLG